LFLIPVRRAQAPVWEVSASHHIEAKKPMPYVNHYSFHILDPEWGHITIKIGGHPPFPAQVLLNGHEYVACQARKAAISPIACWSNPRLHCGWLRRKSMESISTSPACAGWSRQ
jgi:hypothetical protein